MDRDEYQKTLNGKGTERDGSNNPFMFRYGYDSRLGAVKATASWGTNDH